jgi:hypothetical protein
MHIFMKKGRIQIKDDYSGSDQHSCGSGSGPGRIRIILPNPDRHQCQACKKLINYIFFRKTSICYPNTLNYDIFVTDEKDKTLKTGIMSQCD